MKERVGFCFSFRKKSCSVLIPAILDWTVRNRLNSLLTGFPVLAILAAFVPISDICFSTAINIERHPVPFFLHWRRSRIILKDTHTCEHRPERFDRWTRIARDLVDERAALPTG